MEWVETTAKTVEAAKDLALDRLGVAADEAEFDVIEEPRSGLFGRVRGEARVRARVRPTAVRPKQERRRDRKGGKGKGKDDAMSTGDASDDVSDDHVVSTSDDTVATAVATEARPAKSARRTAAGNGDRQQDRPERDGRRSSNGTGEGRPKHTKENTVEESTVTPEQVGEAAVAFMSGLADAFGATSTTSLAIEGDELDVRVTGSDLGVLVGPGGRTLTAIQDLVRVAAQRRLGDHETRLRIDVAGYREKRKGALEQFTQSVAAQVVSSGQAKALEPMSSADRKIVHDTVGEIEGVVSRSDGEDPARRVVIAPA